MIDLSTARERVKDYLLRMEGQMNAFGSGLPGYKYAHHRLVILKESDYEFGWVFCYNTEQYVATGDTRYALAGNAPIIVDRMDGQLHVTGTAYPLDHFIAEYRRGVRRGAEQIAAPEPPLADSNPGTPVHQTLDWLPASRFRGGLMPEPIRYRGPFLPNGLEVACVNDCKIGRTMPVIGGAARHKIVQNGVSGYPFAAPL